jgi:hypothetical protein
MDVRAECVNPRCKAQGIEKLVAIGQVLGYGAANDHVKCPTCDELMRTTQTSAGDPKRLASFRHPVVGKRRPKRASVRRPVAKRMKAKRTITRAPAKPDTSRR